MAIQRKDLYNAVKNAVDHTKITDIHTHLYPPDFDDLMMAGIDELLTYHYLIAETMRTADLTYEAFWNLPKKEQADLIWKTLFIERTPYSEACRGVVTTLSKFDMDLKSKSLSQYREKLPDPYTSDYVDRVFQLSHVSEVVMTNDPFNEKERQIWLEKGNADPRFKAALRIDPLINHYSSVIKDLQQQGYKVEENLTEKTIQELRRFISDWMAHMDALYVAVSLPDTFFYPEENTRTVLIERVILPVCREKNRPFALMIGVKRGMNKELKSAGDSVGKADIRAVENLCRTFPNNKFMITMLSRENQHELSVTARKFRNLMIFGCWWFLNNPSLIDEITSTRFELLGSSVIPQHSDARILDQLVYKWDHFREILIQVLTYKYGDLIDSGWGLELQEVERDIQRLLHDNFWDFIEWELPEDQGREEGHAQH